MSWLFSQALVEVFSGANSSDGEPCAPLSVMPTPHKFWRNDKTMESSKLSQFGLMCAVLTEDRGAELLMSFLEASRARTSARPARESGSTAPGRASGLNSLGSLARWDRSSSSWKTPQCSLVEGLDEFSETWPDWGLMLRGESYQRPTPEPLTFASASGFWPTPNVPNGGRSCAHVTDWRGKTAYHNGKKVQVGLEWAVRSLSTPTARDWKSPGAAERAQPLSEVIGNPHAHPKTWPTPASCNGTGGATGLAGGSGNRKKLYEMLGEVEGKKMGCQTLNPNWVEWLMGWPIGWTDSRPSATARFLKLLPWPFRSSTAA